MWRPTRPGEPRPRRRRCSSSCATTRPRRRWSTSGSPAICENPEAEEDKQRWKAGNLPLFNNVLDGKPIGRRRTILIDSAQLESGDAIAGQFKEDARDEIDAFKRELRQRDPSRDVEKVDDAELLREVMNTVGRKGKLGEQVRCVVSVSMLTEGWDANTVTHVLGCRAFGTQLLCEQVIGRALRRVSYDADDHGMFAPQYAEVLGVPFSFMPANSEKDFKPPKERFRVHAEHKKTAPEIKFPRLEGYRVEFPKGRLTAQFTRESHLELSALWPDPAGGDRDRSAGRHLQRAAVANWRTSASRRWRSCSPSARWSAGRGSPARTTSSR